MTAATLALLAWAAAAGLMLVLWAWHLRIRNAGVVDVGWVASVAGLALLYAWLAPGFAPRRWLIAAMMGTWGARLAWYLLRDRVLGQPEDRRYAELRARRSPAVALAFFPFFQAQAALAVFFSLPALLPAFNGTGSLHALELAAAGLWLIAFAGETAADRQLAAFRAQPGKRGRTCRAGLWRYSRHPNYFFEWLIWIAYGLFALPSPWGWLALACPALMLFLLFRVTGIPATEAQALRTKGDDYRVYQQTTSVFVPWPPRRSNVTTTTQGAKGVM